MNRFRLKFRGNRYHFSGRAVLSVCALFICSRISVLAQAAATPVPSAAFSVRATHLLGFENVKTNCNGTLSIQGDVLRFQPDGKPGAQVNITLVRDVFVGGESKQIGGLPMKLGKAAAPYGAGRVVSLVAHKKYDTLTLEYGDSNGGIHGAVFQLTKGKGELVRNELVGRGVSLGPLDDQSTKVSAVEVMHETK